MGCFNIQCGYSGLEIHDGDDAKVFILVENGNFGDTRPGFSCYQHDEYKIVGAPVDGTYNDYGWFDIDDDNLNAKLIRTWITQNIHVNEAILQDRDRGGKNAYLKSIMGVDPKERELITWDIIGDMIHDGQLYVNTKFGNVKQVHVQKFAVHTQLFEDVALPDLNDAYRNDSYRDRIRKSAQSIRGCSPDIESMTDDEIREKYDIEDIETNSREELVYLASRIARMMASISDCDNLNLRDFMMLSLRDYVDFEHNGQKMDIEEIVEILHNTIHFNVWMGVNNKQYRGSGPGGQCYNLEDEIAHLEHLLNFAREQDKKCLIGWGEWDPIEERRAVYDEDGNMLDRKGIPYSEDVLKEAFNE